MSPQVFPPPPDGSPVLLVGSDIAWAAGASAGGNGAWVQRRDGIVHAFIDGTTNASAVLFTFPVGFRPARSVPFSGGTPGNNGVFGNIGSNGVVETTLVSGRVAFAVAFPAA